MQQDNAPKDLKKVKRGEIYVYDFGKNSDFVRSGVQHVLVIQCDELNQRSPTTIVAVVTMAKKKTKLVSHTVLDTNFGLKSSVTVFF